MRKILNNVMKIGWTMAICAGLAVMVVATVGIASPATAAKAKKATFKLGKTNAVKAVSAMAGSVMGPLLKLDNGAGPALDLQVAQGQAPMTVNSDTKVDKLNADKVDGLDSSELAGQQGEQGPKGDKGDTGAQGAQGPPGSGGDAGTLDGKDSTAFFSGKTYFREGPAVQGSATQINRAFASCDPGDRALSGGHSLKAGSSVQDVRAWNTSGERHEVIFLGTSNVTSNVNCADFPPLRAGASAAESGEQSQEESVEQPSEQPEQ